MDFVLRFPTDLPHKNTGILVLVDRFKKMGNLVAVLEFINASAFAHKFIDMVFRLYSLPRELVSDRGQRFTAEFWRSKF